MQTVMNVEDINASGVPSHDCWKQLRVDGRLFPESASNTTEISWNQETGAAYVVCSRSATNGGRILGFETKNERKARNLAARWAQENLPLEMKDGVAVIPPLILPD